MATANAERAVVDVLRAAKERIGDPSGWIKGDYARTAAGVSVEPADSTATCFCSIGAILNAQGVSIYEGDSLGNPALKMLARAAGSNAIASINDAATHAGVLALFDRAIALAESEQV